jgi:hypothetical protein
VRHTVSYYNAARIDIPTERLKCVDVGEVQRVKEVGSLRHGMTKVSDHSFVKFIPVVFVWLFEMLLNCAIKQKRPTYELLKNTKFNPFLNDTKNDYFLIDLYSSTKIHVRCK